MLTLSGCVRRSRSFACERRSLKLFLEASLFLASVSRALSLSLACLASVRERK